MKGKALEETITVRVDQDLKKLLVKLAKARGVSVSEIIRAAIIGVVERQALPKEFRVGNESVYGYDISDMLLETVEKLFYDAAIEDRATPLYVVVGYSTERDAVDIYIIYRDYAVDRIRIMSLEELLKKKEEREKFLEEMKKKILDWLLS